MDKTAGLRLDKWLVVARFARTRSAAARLVTAGHVRIGGRPAKAPDRRLQAGEILTLALPHITTVVEVLGFAEKRGSASQAQALYRTLSPGVSHSATDVPNQP